MEGGRKKANIFLVEGAPSGGHTRSTGLGSTAHWNLIVETQAEVKDTTTVIKYDAVFDKDHKIRARKTPLSLTEPVIKRWPKAAKQTMTMFSSDQADAYIAEVNSSDLVYNPVTDNCQEFVVNLLSAAASDDAGLHYEVGNFHIFGRDHTFGNSVRTLFYCGYALYTMLYFLILIVLVSFSLKAIYGHQHYQHVSVGFTTLYIGVILRSESPWDYKIVRCLFFPFVQLFFAWTFSWLSSCINTRLLFSVVTVFIVVSPIISMIYNDVFITQSLEWIGRKFQQIINLSI